MPANFAFIRLLAFFLFLCSTTVTVADLPKVPLDRQQFRRPTAIAKLDDATAVVANRCGTLSVVDLDKWAVVAEYQLGGRLTDLATVNGLLLVTDAEGSRLSLISISRQNAQIIYQVPVPTYPVTVQVTPDGSSCTVASKWARKLTFVSLDRLEITGTLDLDFCPGEQLHVPSDSRMLLADTFTGRLAVINTSTHIVEHVHDFGAHNVRGLAISDDGQTLVVSHQILNDAALPRRSDIVWGVMISNLLRTANLDSILDGKSGAMYGGLTMTVGYAGQGAGDPDTLFVDEAGRAVIALAGVNEVSIGVPGSRAFQRIGVGSHPIDLLPLAEGRFVVVNELSDSLTLVDMTKVAASAAAVQSETSAEKSITKKSDSKTPAAKPDQNSPPYDDEYEDADAYDNKYGDKAADDTTASTYQDSDIYTSHLSLGPTPDFGPAERGEQLFFSARLSHASWFSCHSCHVDGHSNGGRSDTFGDDTEGAPKRVLSLLGVGETGPWGWNGKKTTLPIQIHQSAASTMRGKGLSDKSATDLAAFLKTLQPPPPYEPATTSADRALIKDGRQLFESLSCTDCHTGTTLTSPDVYDVGLVDERGLRKFNPPTLRGVGYRENLFHDKRASSLEEVFTKHNHQLDHKLSDTELKSLLRYLRSL
ncbi:MAG: cytochrome c peroxidase [Planctomycetales bacterium]|jgi:mono/diheme cytochrome c family protein